MLATEQAQQQHSPPLNARLLLQIHDELVWQVPDKQLEQFKGILLILTNLNLFTFSFNNNIKIL